MPYCRAIAKTIRPILCPQCGSPAKTTLGPELFRCHACQTEYYLDKDEVAVTVRHQYAAPPASPPRSQALRYGWAGVFLVIAVGALTWLAVRHFRPGYYNSLPATATKPIFYLTQYVYADAERQPVYATLRTEGPRWGADSVTLYADFTMRAPAGCAAGRCWSPWAAASTTTPTSGAPFPVARCICWVISTFTAWPTAPTASSM